MEVAIAYQPSLDAYDFGPTHPLRPERVSRAVSLMRAYGLLDGPLVPVEFATAHDEEIRLVHDRAYVETVKRASTSSGLRIAEAGIGPGDTPAFVGMHEAAAAVAGATVAAVRAVSRGAHTRALSPAGGLHHAHRDRAAGFCVYNDAAVAIATLLAEAPDARVLYIDIDAHHGDGVQEAFYADPRVLTISLHEDGRYLYPGTGSWRERGEGAGIGSAINVPLPPYATPACYSLAFDDVVVPAARSFGPTLVVAQCGADAHWSDPLTSLGMTLPGYERLYGRIVALSDEVCEGRLVACGGGGYAWEHVVPRAWTLLAGALTGTPLPDSMPEQWLADAHLPGVEIPRLLRQDEPPALSIRSEDELRVDTRWVTGKLHDLGVPGP